MGVPEEAAIVAELREAGFRKRAGLIFTKEVASETLGWLGLNRASRYLPAGEVDVMPVVGVRHQGVERAVAELSGGKFHQYVPPTVSVPLGYLMPAGRHRSWRLGGGGGEGEADDLVAAVLTYGVPFMEANASLPALCERLDERLGFDHLIVYRRPTAWAMAGDVARGLALVNAAEAELKDRQDAAAAEFRSFVQPFRERFGQE